MLNINGQQQPAMFHITLSNTQQSLNDETKQITSLTMTLWTLVHKFAKKALNYILYVVLRSNIFKLD